MLSVRCTPAAETETNPRGMISPASVRLEQPLLPSSLVEAVEALPLLVLDLT